MKKKEGFTLIEVVVAMGIMIIGILPILMMYPNALKHSVKATENEEKSRVSVTIVDFIKSRGYTNISNKLLTTSIKNSEYGTTTISGFTKWGDNSYTNVEFEKDFLGGNGTNSSLFFINTKRAQLSQDKFMVSIQKISPEDGAGNFVYGEYDLKNYTKNSSTSNSNLIIYGIVKIRGLNENYLDEEKNKDIKFLITPMEEWGK